MGQYERTGGTERCKPAVLGATADYGPEITQTCLANWFIPHPTAGFAGKDFSTTDQKGYDVENFTRRTALP